LIDDDDYNLNVIKLGTLAKNIKRRSSRWFFFPSFITRYHKRRTYNMLALILDPKFKSLKLIFFFNWLWAWGVHSWKVW
jgi:hypothetical protein